MTVTGVVDPAVEGQEVVVSLAGVDVGAALTDATGAFALEFAPGNSGDVAARLDRRRQRRARRCRWSCARPSP